MALLQRLGANAMRLKGPVIDEAAAIEHRPALLLETATALLSISLEIERSVYDG